MSSGATIAALNPRTPAAKEAPSGQKSYNDSQKGSATCAIRSCHAYAMCYWQR